MKLQNVPQDNTKYDEGKIIVRDVVYAVDENGKYTTAVSTGWSVKTDALEAFWDTIDEECEPLRQQVLAGHASPIAYYMKRNMLDVGMLSAYTGISKRDVKRHLAFAAFSKLEDAVLQKYATAFRMTVDELKHV